MKLQWVLINFHNILVACYQISEFSSDKPMCFSVFLLSEILSAAFGIFAVFSVDGSKDKIVFSDCPKASQYSEIGFYT